MVKWLMRSAVLLVVLALVAHLLLPGYVERQLNHVVLAPPYTVSAADSAQYARLPFIADLHSDAMLWGRDLTVRSDRGHVDIPRLLEAGVALQVFTAVTKTPKGQNYSSNSDETDNITALMVVQGRRPATWTSLFARGIDMAARLQDAAAKEERFRIITSGSKLRDYLADRQRDAKQTAGMLGVEGLHLLEGKLENLDELYRAGYRVVAPVHFFDNEVGGSAHGVAKGGLTPFGKTVLAQAERRSMIIDISHGSTALIDDVLDLAERPILVTHTGVRALCPGDRNLSDDQLRRIAAGGGLVGIAMFEQAVCGVDASATARHIAHAVEIMGLQHVALGSDFDGAVTTPFDVTGLPLLLSALREEGFSESDMAAIMGGNVRDFFIANLPAE